MKRVVRLSPLIQWILKIGCIFLLIMTLMRIGLYLYFNKQDYDFQELANAFILGFRFDLRVVSIILLSMVFLGNVPGLNPFRYPAAKKIWLGSLAIIIFIILFFHVIDFAHYGYLSKRLNASVLNYLQDASISLNMVWESYPVIWLVIGLMLATIFIWLLVKWTFDKTLDTNFVSGKQRIVEFTVCFIVFGMMIFGRFSQYPLRWSDAFALGSDYKANLALNPFESFFNTLKFRGNNYDENRLKEFYPVLSKYYDLKTDSGKISFTRNIIPNDTLAITPNVVLIICESFSTYKSSLFGNPFNTTPFFDSLSRNGLFFDRCFTPAYGTARGVWSIITGTPDVEAPSTASRNPAAVDQHTIINDFTTHEKFYFLGGSTSWANIRGLLTNNITGLNIYEQDNFDAPKIDVWGISDKNLFLEANKILARQNKPFFATIQTADNHRPYTIPEEDLDEFKKLEPSFDSLRKFGFESVEEFNAFRYTDFCFKKFMEAAKKEKYFDNTIFAFIGDHGIPGNANEIFPNAWTEQRLTSHHVPLLYYAPKLISAQRNSTIASQIDVLPVLAGISRIPYQNTTLGRDLLDPGLKNGFAFLFDLDKNQIGLVNRQYLFRKRINTTMEEWFSVVDDNQLSYNSIPADREIEFRKLSEALYEASKYLLLNNKKTNEKGAK